MLRIESREDCIVFLCDCGGCDAPVATLRRDRNAGLRIESNHHGKKHTNVMGPDDLAWIEAYLSGPDGSIIREAYLSGPDGSIIREGLAQTAQPAIETLKL